MSPFLLLSLAVILLSVYLSQVTARRKGLNPVFWGLMGALFGPLTLLPLLLIKSRRPPVAAH